MRYCDDTRWSQFILVHTSIERKQENKSSNHYYVRTLPTVPLNGLWPDRDGQGHTGPGRALVDLTGCWSKVRYLFAIFENNKPTLKRSILVIYQEIDRNSIQF